MYVSMYVCMCVHVFYKKPNSRPRTKSVLIFGQILVLKVS